MTSFYFNLFSPYFLQLYCPNGISPMGKWGYFPQEKPAATESTYCACWVSLCSHNPPNSDMDYGIFNVRADVNAQLHTGVYGCCKSLH